MKTAEHRAAEREARELRRHLKALTASVGSFLAALDAAMNEPESRERGQKIARLANALDLANDTVRYFALKVDWRKDRKGRPPAADRAAALKLLLGEARAEKKSP